MDQEIHLRNIDEGEMRWKVNWRHEGDKKFAMEMFLLQ